MSRTLRDAFLPRRPLQWFGVLAVSTAFALAVGAAVVLSGLLDLRASTPDRTGVAQLVHFTFQRSVAANARAVPPRDLDSTANVMKGAAHYANVCAQCHGAPGLDRGPVALSLRPEPPSLAQVTERYSTPELFYVVLHGVSYSAMPAWPVSDREDEVWAVVSFLRAMPEMDFATYRRLARGPLDAPRETAGAQALPVGPADADAGFGWPRDALADAAAGMPGTPDTALRIGDQSMAPPVAGFLPALLDDEPLAVCADCHGADGAGRADGAFPNLTLQGEAYLRNALAAYATGRRQSGIMWPVAMSLSRPQVEALAAHFGAMEPRPSKSAVDAAPDLLARGRTIATEGLDAAAGAAAVAACASCHGLDDRLFPRLAGQYAAYTENQMRVFRDGGRGDVKSYNPMAAVAHGLNDRDIAAVAAYYASLPPGAKADGEAAAAPGREGGGRAEQDDAGPGDG